MVVANEASYSDYQSEDLHKLLVATCKNVPTQHALHIRIGVDHRPLIVVLYLVRMLGTCQQNGFFPYGVSTIKMITFQLRILCALHMPRWFCLALERSA